LHHDETGQGSPSLLLPINMGEESRIGGGFLGSKKKEGKERESSERTEKKKNKKEPEGNREKEEGKGVELLKD